MNKEQILKDFEDIIIYAENYMDEYCTSEKSFDEFYDSIDRVREALESL